MERMDEGMGETAGIDGTPVIEVAGVTKAFGSTIALRDASLGVAQGEIVVLLGLSGSGKSTLL
ncbi:MAG TPA: ATP-binding cassette domain-containing protein, partial [Agromyces sp.]